MPVLRKAQKFARNPGLRKILTHANEAIWYAEKEGQHENLHLDFALGHAKMATGGRLDFFLDLGQSFTKRLFESILCLCTVLCNLCNPYNAR